MVWILDIIKTINFIATYERLVNLEQKRVSKIRQMKEQKEIESLLHMRSCPKISKKSRELSK